MISGAHLVIFTQDADADRDFFCNTLGFSSVDAGHGWLIFSLPPTEAAFHPSESNDRHELYFMCDDLETEMEALRAKGVQCSDVKEEQWGLLTTIPLPGGGNIGLYEPRHPTAH